MAIVGVTSQVTSVRNDISRIIRDYGRWDNSFVAIGWSAWSGRYPNGTLVAQVAVWNEFGTHNEDGSVRSPARPFMRPAYADNRAAINAMRDKVVEAVNAGRMTPEKGLDTMGYRFVQWVRAKILSNTPPPLAARTLAKKRRDSRPAVTLIDTRRMLDSLSYRIYLGMLSSTAQETSTAAASLARAKQVTGDTAAKQSARAQALRDRVMTSKQIKREKKALKEELVQAKRAKKREGQRLARKIKTVKGNIKRAKQRTEKRQRKQDAALKAYASRQATAYERREKKKLKRESAERKAAENRVIKNQRKQRKKYVKQVQHAVKVKKAKDRRMKERDKREAKGLSRIQHLTPQQKEAKAAREKLVKSNKARLRNEKRAEKREIQAEKLAKISAQKAERKANKATKKTSKGKARR